MNMSIPTKRQVFFSIATDNDFIERTLLAMYRRHQANKGILNGKGFNRKTMKDGVRLGKWLDTRGNGHFTSGEGTRSTKDREVHLQKARDVLFCHVDQIIDMMIEDARTAQLASRNAAAPQIVTRTVPVPAASPRQLSDQEQLSLNLQRSRELVAMLEAGLAAQVAASVPAEPVTEKNLGGATPWRGTGMRRTG